MSDMTRQSVSAFCNAWTFKGSDYALQGTLVHHYVYITDRTYAYCVITHCHVTGASQSVTCETFKDLRDYLLGFESPYAM